MGEAVTNWQSRKLTNAIENFALIVGAVACGLLHHTFYCVLLIVITVLHELVFMAVYPED